MSRSVRDPDYRRDAQPEHQGYCWPSLGEPCRQCHRCSRDPYEDAGRALYLIEHPHVHASAWPLVDQETRDWWVNKARPIADAVRRTK